MAAHVTPPDAERPRLLVRPISSGALGLLLLGVDYWLGPEIQTPVVYLIPITLAAWHGQYRWALALAVLLPLARLYFISPNRPSAEFLESAVNAVIRITVFAFFAWIIHRAATQLRYLRRLFYLQRMAGLCTGCGRIQDKRDDTWHSLDSYVKRHPQEFRRRQCPHCAELSDSSVEAYEP